MMDVVDSKPVSISEVAVVLKGKEKEYAEREIDLLYEQRRALEHAAKYSKVSVKDAEAMKSKLSELELNLTEERIVKIIDLMPNSVDDIRAIFAKERFRYSEEEIKKITDVVDQYR
ncbi:MAG: DNA-directed RNA polymerase subunit F [Candidatus Altiarchaeales archaeon]|nr:DNA-directed RNA polymerase subunit F [Candidatus Altiarchaeales archaeon]MBD3415670.1 DNA-directed RNA polymerase subunit F [Candidatus Altiarchaeales archaeon]